jgi:hypothetical protein
MQTTPDSKIREWLDGEEFNGIAYSYRSTPIQSQIEVLNRWKELKDAIECKFNELYNITMMGETMKEETELTKELRTPKHETVITLQTVSQAITAMYKDVEGHENNVLNVLNRLHGINYPYPYTHLDRDFYDAYKSLRDLQLKLREAAASIIAK